MVRGLLSSAIYKKTTEISITALDNSASVTLMSADIQRIVDGFKMMHEVWANVVEIGIATYLLERQMGLACIAPVVVAAASGGASMILAGNAGKHQKQWMEDTQRRVGELLDACSSILNDLTFLGITASMLSTMKGVKMTGLSKKLSSMIKKLRIQELESATRFRMVLVWTVATGKSSLYVTQK